MDSPVWVYLLGLSGMAIYGSRILIQWWMSEKSHQVESPAIYWILSSIGAIPLYIYGWLRKDFSIILGESLGYYIYMWNIGIMGLYKKVPKTVFIVQALFPLIILALITKDFKVFADTFLRNEYVPLKLLLFGVLGQVTYESRTIYQLIYSYRRRGSYLPLGHWILAVAGSTMIIIYGLIRHDWVLAIGQFSIFFSIRNLMLSVASRRRRKIVTTLFMVRPVRFGFNTQTAGNNHFQHQADGSDIQARALAEFDGMVTLLKRNEIPVMVYEDTPEPETPDSIFPNNWFSTHIDGSLVLYPMFAPNRRSERTPEAIEAIKKAADTRRVIDLTGWEKKKKFLEGTGSMVLDRKNRIAYACRSPRTSKPVLDEFCLKMGFIPCLFDAKDRDGNPIYHTNVIMSIGDDFAVVCRDVVVSLPEYTELVGRLSSAGKRVVEITYEQMMQFACNILEVENIRGEKFVVMSETALGSLRQDQIAAIKGERRNILPVHIPTIEEIGGGGARCMMAEILHPMSEPESE
ncbi:MAG: lipid-A-disaccharide synthase N-terminal domain-containing protein [Bacteroidales bacterium]|nr:lipid-A-disaccharide synthase N-terminal domain-containing protein [Bacteroidales bacterium]